MAKQTEIGYESTKEWQDYQTGGTRIDAADLNNMEQGIADACAAAGELRTKRLPTYVVLEGGDTATQDAYAEPILGPCLILDLATRTTYYESGGDEEGHRKAITSGADIDALRDSLSHYVSYMSNFSTDGSFTMPKRRAVVFVQKSDYVKNLLLYFDGSSVFEWLRGSSFSGKTEVSDNGDETVTLSNTDLNYSTWIALFVP